MKNSNIIAFGLLFFLIASCKKDYPYVPMEVDHPQREFFASGLLYKDLEHQDSIKYNGPGTGSTSSVGYEFGKKYIVFFVGYIYRIDGYFSWSAQDYVWALENAIALKIRSDRPPAEENRHFTRDELLGLLKTGKQYNFGNNPGEIQVDISRQGEKLGLNNLLYGKTAGMPNQDNFMEILSIEDYQDRTHKGFKVKVRLEANMRHLQTDFYFAIKDMEGVFLFEYE